MNTYKFDEISIGTAEKFEVTVTEEMMLAFRGISGDVNPLHCELDYALSEGFPGKLVYGMLTASFFSTLAGVYLPGKYCLLHSVETDFHKPVFVGDRLTVKGVVKEKNESFRLITIKASVTNQNGEKVCKAKIVAGVLK